MAQSVNLDLADVIRRADEFNLDLLIERTLVEDARFAARSARSGLLPELNANVSQARSLEAIVGSDFFDSLAELFEAIDFPSAGDASSDGFEINPSNRFDVSIDATWDILNLNKLATSRLARYDFELSEFALEELRQEVLDRSATGFFNYLRAQARLAVIDANIRRDEVLRDQAQALLDSGTGIQLDVTRAEVRIANGQRERLQQETEVLRTGLALKTVLDIAFEAELITEPLTEATLPEPGPSAMAYDLNAILSARPEFQRAEWLLERNRFAKRAAKWERLPSVGVAGSYGYADRTAFGGDRARNWRIAIAMEVPIYAGGRFGANQARADNSIRTQEMAIRNLRNIVDSELRVAAQDVRSRFQQIVVAQAAREVSQLELSQAQQRFESGVADNSDVIDAQANLAAADDELVEALFQYNLSRIVLARAKGDVRMLAAP